MVVLSRPSSGSVRPLAAFRDRRRSVIRAAAPHQTANLASREPVGLRRERLLLATAQSCHRDIGYATLRRTRLRARTRWFDEDCEIWVAGRTVLKRSSPESVCSLMSTMAMAGWQAIARSVGWSGTALDQIDTRRYLDHRVERDRPDRSHRSPRTNLHASCGRVWTTAPESRSVSQDGPPRA